MARREPRASRRPAPAAPRPAAESPNPRRASLLDRIPWDWMAVVFSLFLLAWLGTDGDWSFFPKGGFLETFYDAQAQSLVHGHMDVPPQSIATEAFVHNGKSYGYFGPTPALMRLPLNLLLPGMYGRWSRVSMLLASLLTMGMLLLLMRRLEERFPLPGGPGLRNFLRGVLVLAVALGSTNFFVTAERKVYQESIIWGSALALAHAVLLMCYLMQPKARWLALSCVAAILAFLARVSSGSGPLFALFLVEAAWLLPVARARGYFTGAPVPRRAAAAVGVTLLAAVALWAGLNYGKFGMVFTSQPIALNMQFDRERLERVKGNLFSLYNLPLTVSNYFAPDKIAFRETFPWAFLVQGDPNLAARFPKAHFDNTEPFASLPAAMPQLLLAAIAGLALCLARRRRELRELRAPICGALAGGALIFTFGYISYRYLHDLFPFLVLGSAAAVAYLPALADRKLRYGLATLFVLATLYAASVNFAIALRWQRYSCYPIPQEKRVAFTDMCSVIDQRGLDGLVWYASHWHRYIPAASFQGGNLAIDRRQLAERGDQPVVRSQGPPPYGAEYAVDLPSAGSYQLAILYASAERRPVHLFINGQDLKEVCGDATGGWLPSARVWGPAGVFQLNAGPNRIGLASFGPFPPIGMLRLIRVD